MKPMPINIPPFLRVQESFLYTIIHIENQTAVKAAVFLCGISSVEGTPP